MAQHSSRMVIGASANGRGQRPTAAASKRSLQRPPPKAAKKSKAPSATAQSSILRFLIPKVESDRDGCQKSVESDDDFEVTGVAPASASGVRQPTSPAAASPPLPQPPPLPLPLLPSASAKQSSLLRFFTSSSGGGGPAKPPQPQPPPLSAPPRPASGTWPSSGHQTVCPPVKWVEGTDLTVDAFNYGVQTRCLGYFLSHFHSDHYCGLGRGFDGHLLASRQTADLVRLRLGVRPACVRPLDLQQWHEVPGAQVLLLDANHCPGSVLLLFRLPSGRRVLHTGDFRASPDLLASVLGWLGDAPEVDSLYLDTTYCSPEYDFPPQADVIQSVLRLVAEFVRDFPRYLIACGSYALGKERIFVSVARHLGCRAGVDPAKFRLLSALGDAGISEWIVRNTGGGGAASCSRLQVLPLRCVTHAGLRKFLATWRGPPVDGVLGISPTGWSLGARGVQVSPGLKRLHGGGGGNSPDIAVFAAAYSEHSSFGELRDFVRGLRPRRILPTVNWHRRDACSRMRAHFDCWLRE